VEEIYVFRFCFVNFHVTYIGNTTRRSNIDNYSSIQTFIVHPRHKDNKPMFSTNAAYEELVVPSNETVISLYCSHAHSCGLSYWEQSIRTVQE
jgi:hypothetical protein